MDAKCVAREATLTRAAASWQPCADSSAEDTAGVVAHDGVESGRSAQAISAKFCVGERERGAIPTSA